MKKVGLVNRHYIIFIMILPLGPREWLVQPKKMDDSPRWSHVHEKSVGRKHIFDHNVYVIIQKTSLRNSIAHDFWGFNMVSIGFPWVFHRCSIFPWVFPSNRRRPKKLFRRIWTTTTSCPAPAAYVPPAPFWKTTIGWLWMEFRTSHYWWLIVINND